MNKEERREYNREYYETHKEEARKYYKKHKEGIMKNHAKYIKTEKGKEATRKYEQSEKGKESGRRSANTFRNSKKGGDRIVKYRGTHKEETREHHKKYTKTEKGKEAKRKAATKYQKTPKGREVVRKTRFKRRQLGFIPLNEPFPNSDAHHIDTEFAIYIPKELHKSVSYNLHTGQGMEQINEIAIDFCYGD